MPDLAGLVVKEGWLEIEGGQRLRSWRGWILLALGLGVYLVIMTGARLFLPAGHHGLTLVEYLLVHAFLYFPLPLLFAFGGFRRGWRAILPWFLAVIIPAALAALARGDLLLHPGSGTFPQLPWVLRFILYPAGLGLWVSLLFIPFWRRSSPEGLADLGLAPLAPRRAAVLLGLGLAASLALLLHLYLTLYFSGLARPAWAGIGAVWAKGGLTLAQESLGEELFYRGFFFQYLRRRDWSFWPAALLVSCFDAAHFLFLPSTLNNLAMAVGLVYYVFIYSVVNCALVDRTKSLLPAWGANALFTMLVGALKLAL